MYTVLMVLGFVQVGWVIENVVTSHYWSGTLLSIVSGALCFGAAYVTKRANS